jgi:hypothetical protein
MPWGFEPLHTLLALTRRPMRLLTPVIEIAALAVLHAREELSAQRAWLLAASRPAWERLRAVGRGLLPVTQPQA